MMPVVMPNLATWGRASSLFWTLDDLEVHHNHICATPSWIHDVYSAILEDGSRQKHFYFISKYSPVDLKQNGGWPATNCKRIEPYIFGILRFLAITYQKSHSGNLVEPPFLGQKQNGRHSSLKFKIFPIFNNLIIFLVLIRLQLFVFHTILESLESGL